MSNSIYVLISITKINNSLYYLGGITLQYPYIIGVIYVQFIFIYIYIYNLIQYILEKIYISNPSFYNIFITKTKKKTLDAIKYNFKINFKVYNLTGQVLYFLFRGY